MQRLFTTNYTPSLVPAKQRSSGAGEVQGVTAFQTNKMSQRQSLSCFLSQAPEAFPGRERRPIPSDSLLQCGFESWVSNPPPSCQIETFSEVKFSFPTLVCIYPARKMIFSSPYFFPSHWPVIQGCNQFIKRMKGSPTCLKRDDGK